MWIQPISSDYTTLLGNHTALFQGGDAKWSSVVVDGPSMLYINQTFFLFWSSFNQYYNGKYCCGYAKASNLFGPYTQSEEPVIWNDGGHSSWFYRNDTGQLQITYHEPNGGNEERAQIRQLN